MKNKYIQSLLTEIQLLESKVSGLIDNQTVSFSFFKEAFRHTQEIMRLLHTLEFVQIEDMKSQMEKLVQFLSEASEQSESSAESEKRESHKQYDPEKSDEEKLNETDHIGISPSKISSLSQKTSKVEIKEDFPQIDSTKEKQKEEKAEHVTEESEMDNQKEVIQPPAPPTSEAAVKKEIKKDEGVKPAAFASESKTREDTAFVKEGATKDSPINAMQPTGKSLNDMQPASHTIMDSKRSISLNDRFLFQRELFNNDRHAMNNMMIKMQAFTTFAERKAYLENNTDWDFKDETVQKFMDLLKEGF